MTKVSPDLLARLISSPYRLLFIMATKHIDVIVDNSINPLDVKNQFMQLPDKYGRLKWAIQITVPFGQLLKSKPDLWLDVKHKNSLISGTTVPRPAQELEDAGTSYSYYGDAALTKLICN